MKILYVVLDYEHRDDGEHVVLRGVYDDVDSIPPKRSAATHRNVVEVFLGATIDLDAFGLGGEPDA